MKILIIGRKNLFNLQDVAEEYEIYQAFLELGQQAEFAEISTVLEKIPAPPEKDKDYDWVFIAKCITRSHELLPLKAKFPTAKFAYWQPDYGRMADTEGGFQVMASYLDLYIGRMREQQSWFAENNIPYLYWNFDVACTIFQKENGKQILWAEPQTPYPDVVPIGFAGNWVHNPFRANLLRDIQYECGDLLHITTSTITEFEKRDDLRNVHLPAYGHKFNYLVDSTQINLSIESSWQPGFWGPRTARIMAAGGFALVFLADPAMTEVFGPNRKNVVYFENSAQAVTEIRYYLSHDAERQEIAERGYNFANQYLRPTIRVKELLENLHL